MRLEKIERGRFFWASIRAQWQQTLFLREMLYGTEPAMKRIQSIHGPGGMAFLRCGLQWALEWAADLMSYTSHILRLLAFFLSWRLLPDSPPPSTTDPLWPMKEDDNGCRPGD